MTATMLVTDDGELLEARWDVPRGDVRGVVVFCHPHPQHAGTMSAPLMNAVTGALADHGLRVLRFNFRGVGRSTGTWGSGVDELHDVDAAVRAAHEAAGDLPIALAGWSFGAATALRWQAEHGSVIPYAGIAPPLASDRTPPLPDPVELGPGRRLFVLGDRDQFVTTDDLGAYADRIGARLEVLAGSDHFFTFRERRVGELLVSGLLPAG